MPEQSGGKAIGHTLPISPDCNGQLVRFLIFNFHIVSAHYYHIFA